MEEATAPHAYGLPGSNELLPAHNSHAMIVFVDIRGFTAWSQHVTPSLLTEFLTHFYAQLHGAFPGTYIKTMGDGALIIHGVPIPATMDAVTVLLTQLLRQVGDVERQFQGLRSVFELQYGATVLLALGWGIVRGIITELRSPDLDIHDYVGAEINKASRLCALARPQGVMIDAADFPLVPTLAADSLWGQAVSVAHQTFLPQEHLLKGVAEPIHAWALLTMNTTGTLLTEAESPGPA